MKTVNFIEAIEHAKRGKEVSIKHKEESYYLVCQKTEYGISVMIIDRFTYRDLKSRRTIFPEETCDDIEFYLNKWTIEDEEESN